MFLVGAHRKGWKKRTAWRTWNEGKNDIMLQL